MATSPSLMTAEELWSLPKTEVRRQLVKGELRTMAPAGFEHGSISLRIATLLANYVREHDLGIVVGAETGFILHRDPDTVLGPDAAFVCKDRLVSTGIPREFFPGYPDLAVEVISPRDTVYEVEEKAQAYLDAGTRLVWVVNPQQHTITVYRPGPTVRVLREAEKLSGEDVVQGFMCEVYLIFT